MERGIVMELFLIAFVYLVYKAMTYDVRKLDERAWEKYDQEEKDNGK